MKTSQQTDFIIQTNQHVWSIPYNCRFLKLLLQEQNIKPCDLEFDSSRDCNNFIKAVFLMALEDEYATQQKSILTDFGRALIQAQYDTY